MIDLDRAATLLHVADKAKQWPRLKPIHDAAMAELEAMQEPEAPKAIPATPVVTRRLEPEGEA